MLIDVRECSMLSPSQLFCELNGEDISGAHVVFTVEATVDSVTPKIIMF